ncbi:hypothetical protein EON67_05370 [archaeon]|nr:MAG: hypothetical protein EON67_05370 [archaeon]
MSASRWAITRRAGIFVVNISSSAHSLCESRAPHQVLALALRSCVQIDVWTLACRLFGCACIALHLRLQGAFLVPATVAVPHPLPRFSRLPACASCLGCRLPPPGQIS